MLVRRPDDGSEFPIHQEQHALISGLLAAAWQPKIDPRLVAAITMHDAPWRPIDAALRRGADGRIVDFVAYPIEERLVFYQAGITDLEPVDAYVAYLVSLHYSSFAGTAKLEPFVRAEQTRRERLAPRVGERVENTPTDLAWLQFFDVLSLHVCLTGPDVPAENLPIWLRDPTRWANTPDGRSYQLAWTASETLTLDPFPFAEPWTLHIDCADRPQWSVQLARAQ